ncbi:MAG: 50S ribosomal protein L5 [Gammaproteobacteria bacterium]|nr:50S ribosomal protein L5 [Gammaproteobacteria bacterium]
MTETHPRLHRHYLENVQPKLQEDFGFTNVNQIPRPVKVVLNVGVGEASKNQKFLDSVVEEMSVISGQKPVVTRARKSNYNFSLSKGMQVGCRVTLRRRRMYEFLDRLVSATIPRIRDFRGLSTKSFDGRGNYSLGVREQIIFPEIDYDRIDRIHGMDITVVTSTSKDDEALALLRELGFPFRGSLPVIIGQNGAA